MGFLKRVFMGFALIVVGVPVLLVALLFLGEDRASLNYKLTYTVEAAQQQFTGASVVSVTRSDTGNLPLPGGGGTGNIYKGEAVVVDLGEGRYLFSLLRSATSVGHAGYLATLPFEDSLWPQTPRGHDVSDFTVVDFVRLLKKQKPSTTLAPEDYPLLVTFKDINDPSSVVEVDPYDLDAAFGLCADGSGWRDEQAPWRASGMLYKQWAQAEPYRLAIVRAAGAAGISGAAAKALEERAFILKPNWGPVETERARLKELEALYTAEQLQSWQAAREALMAELASSLPSPQKLAASHGAPCHSLQSVTIAITSERRTKGKVEKVLGWIDSDKTFEGARWDWKHPDYEYGKRLKRTDFRTYQK